MNTIRDISHSNTDNDLVLSYKATGSLDTLGSLYSRYTDLVYGVCLKYLKNSDDAKDATINLFEELIGKVKKHPIDYFKGWLYQVAKNHCLMILRKTKQYTLQIDGEFVQFADESHPEEALQKENQLQLMEDCIRQLNESQQNTIRLFYLQGKCYKEISLMTQMEIGTVKSHIQNGRRNLKICMEKN